MLLVAENENNGWIRSTFNLTYRVSWPQLLLAVHGAYPYFANPQVLVDEDDDLCEVVESGVDRLEHLLPRDAVRQGERRTDPAVVDVLAFQVHGTAPLVLSVIATRVGVGRQAVVDDASAPSEGLAVGTCIMISMESMSWHIDLLNFS